MYARAKVVAAARVCKTFLREGFCALHVSLGDEGVGEQELCPVGEFGPCERAEQRQAFGRALGGLLHLTADEVRVREALERQRSLEFVARFLPDRESVREVRERRVRLSL